MVKRWFNDFKCGHTDTNDTERSGHPNSAVVLENAKKLHELVLANHKLKLHEIEEELKISESSVFTILHEHLAMRKLCLKWVLHLLIVDQKQKCVDDSEHCLQLFQCNKKEFLHVTLDKTWIYHFTQESNQQSAEWHQQVKAIQSHQRCKHQQARFWPPYFGMHNKFSLSITLKNERTINREYHIALMVRLKEEITKKWPQMKKEVLFHQDNALCHKSIATMAKLHKLHFKLLLHPSYLLDMAPSDYWLFEDLKRMLQRKRFGSNEEVISETEVF